VLASLNHPHIAAIYGVEERALVMELLEGPTLAERIWHGAMACEEVLPIMNQLVYGFEYAHEKGIVHRDLKPANIKITPEGKVKVLDFGLAKAATPDASAGNPVDSPTLTMRSTVVGALLGTAAYMAPEQARGHNVDKRADIWAFGVVVYEMATGCRLFDGPTVSDTLAAVLTKEPDWDRVPERLRRLLRLCLRKDPCQRLRDIGDTRMVLTEPPPTVAIQQLPRRASWPSMLAGCLAVALAIAGGLLWRATRPQEGPLDPGPRSRSHGRYLFDRGHLAGWRAAGLRRPRCRRPPTACHAFTEPGETYVVARHERCGAAVFLSRRAVSRLLRRRQVEDHIGAGRRAGDFRQCAQSSGRVAERRHDRCRADAIRPFRRCQYRRNATAPDPRPA
jgi:hypothetical protein